MKYQAFTYETEKVNGEYHITDTIAREEKRVSSDLDFSEILEVFGFNPEYVSMDPDFENSVRIQLMLNDGQPVGYLQQLLD